MRRISRPPCPPFSHWNSYLEEHKARMAPWSLIRVQHIQIEKREHPLQSVYSKRINPLHQHCQPVKIYPIKGQVQVVLWLLSVCVGVVTRWCVSGRNTVVKTILNCLYITKKKNRRMIHSLDETVNWRILLMVVQRALKHSSVFPILMTEEISYQLYCLVAKHGRIKSIVFSSKKLKFLTRFIHWSKIKY